MPAEMNFMIGGEAGQGVQSIGFLLSKAFARGGHHIFADQDYESRIRGGHSFFRVRVKDKPVYAVVEPVDMLLALNKETIDLHLKELTPKGIIIYDGEKIKLTNSDSKLFSVPLEKLAEEAGGKIMSNTVALGAALGLIKYDFELLVKLLREHFGHKGDIAEANVKAAKAGFDYAGKEFTGDFSHHLSPIGDGKRLLLNGTDAVSLGALAAGCKFVSAYPMTPTTPIMEYIASKSKDFNVVVVHAEDEIAAMNMAVGAGYAGVRAMTATSGSGFCLMVEGLGLAGITETPIVVIEGQRPGPAVGLPTRTEQGDLEFILYAHHGEFPRSVLTPATIEDCFWQTAKAFNLAEKYQTPAIVIIDHHLATAYNTVEIPDISKITIERGEIFTDAMGDPAQYKRHQVTASGVSPRALPGLGKALVVTDCDEHSEEGHLTESAEDRTQQVSKRLRKMDGLRNEIAPPRRYGPKNAATTLIGWGSTYGALSETVDILRGDKVDINLVHFNEIWPFPADAAVEALSTAKKVYDVESNATAQFAHILRAETGKKVDGKILRFDGRPITPAFIIERMRKEGYL